jgi:hypothetical protein
MHSVSHRNLLLYWDIFLFSRALPHLKHNFVTQFPAYGFTRRVHPESASASRGLKAPAYPPPVPRAGSALRVSLRGRGPRAAALATTAGALRRPRALSSPAVVRSAGPSGLRPDPPGLRPSPDFAVRLSGRSCPPRVLPTGPTSFPALPRPPEYHAASLTPEGPSGAYSRPCPDATRHRSWVRGA